MVGSFELKPGVARGRVLRREVSSQNWGRDSLSLDTHTRQRSSQVKGSFSTIPTGSCKFRCTARSLAISVPAPLPQKPGGKTQLDVKFKLSTVRGGVSVSGWLRGVSFPAAFRPAAASALWRVVRTCLVPRHCAFRLLRSEV